MDGGLSRSSNGATLPEVLAALDAAARLAGGSFEVTQDDPGWRPDLDSPGLAAVSRVYELLFGEPPIVTAVHAWLETAVIGERVPDLDVERFWRLLGGTVDELSRVPT
jgi:dipeptidase D